MLENHDINTAMRLKSHTVILYKKVTPIRNIKVSKNWHAYMV